MHGNKNVKRDELGSKEFMGRFGIETGNRGKWKTVKLVAARSLF